MRGYSSLDDICVGPRECAKPEDGGLLYQLGGTVPLRRIIHQQVRR